MTWLPVFAEDEMTWLPNQPRNGEIKATGEYCPHCDAPLVVVQTRRGPWKLCPNLSCPSQKKDDEKKSSTRGRKSTRRKSGGKK